MTDARVFRDPATGCVAAEVPLDGSVYDLATGGWAAATQRCACNSATSLRLCLCRARSCSLLIRPPTSPARAGAVLTWCPKDGNPMRSLLGTLKGKVEPTPLKVFPVHVTKDGDVWTKLV